MNIEEHPITILVENLQELLELLTTSNQCYTKVEIIERLEKITAQLKRDFKSWEEEMNAANN